MTKINIFSENIHKSLDKSLKFNEKKAIETAKKILLFFLKEKNIFESSCLLNQKFNCISFDILYCDDEKTHQINKEYRQKDYPADIITFAIFADSEEKFIFDGEINLGEIIISLDKVLEEAKGGMEGKMYRGTADLESHTSSLPALQPSKKPFPLSADFEKQLYFLISHGIMHLLGFDHQTEEDYNFIIKTQNSALAEVRGEK